MSDYIKREDAERLLRYDFLSALTEDERVDELNRIPSADVIEVKHGKWTVRATSYNDKLNFGCSVCHKRYLRGVGENFNYCPNCGARMDGKEHE